MVVIEVRGLQSPAAALLCVLLLEIINSVTEAQDQPRLSSHIQAVINR